ncbi:F1-ATPase subunit H [Schizosaccharomyces japonicus yFS275]|uniref:F1-ATPase subunit H n=1 Tax=Schizosaccharomyces japonicus (strain yFS275 / FY16936) TaxID=402676 RepID=B6JVX7_SCHJY|nr:F1-ATPase subunit H [Schizosaccharomyces japonicus yFS275]EEB05528.1 F1-ATPase subunit H [Schizosaccharomyces japonicus yFS275]
MFRGVVRNFSTTIRRNSDVIQELYLSTLKAYKPKPITSIAITPKEWVPPPVAKAPIYSMDASALADYKFEGIDTTPEKLKEIVETPSETESDGLNQLRSLRL